MSKRKKDESKCSIFIEHPQDLVEFVANHTEQRLIIDILPGTHSRPIFLGMTSFDSFEDLAQHAIQMSKNVKTERGHILVRLSSNIPQLMTVVTLNSRNETLYTEFYIWLNEQERNVIAKNVFHVDQTTTTKKK